MTAPAPTDLSAAKLRRVYAVRSGLRQFHRWSKSHIQAAGITPARYDLLLAVKALNGEDGPSITAVAAALAITHHSAVELANHAETAGHLHRHRDPHDARVVRLTLTSTGNHILDSLAPHHREELRRLGLLLQAAVADQ